MNSGTSKNNEPIEPIEQLNLKDKMAKKTAVTKTTTETEAPRFRTETDKGEQIRVPMEHVEKLEPLEKANAKALAKAIGKEKVVKEKAPKVEKVAGVPTKQDKIVALLRDGATGKEIKLLLAEEGLKVYDSEILSAKKKVTSITEA